MKPSQYSSFNFRETFISSLLLLAFILSLAIYNYCTNSSCYIFSLRDNFYSTNNTITLAPAVKIKRMDEKLPFAIGEGNKNNSSGCDLFSGRWVRDYTRPLYEEWECPYIKPQLTCQEHGRPDKDYLFWRWQPNDCSIPRYKDIWTGLIIKDFYMVVDLERP